MSRPLLALPVVVLTEWFLGDQLGLHDEPGRFSGSWLAVVTFTTVVAAGLKLRWGFRHWLADAILNAFLGLGALTASLVSGLSLLRSVLAPDLMGVGEVLISTAWLVIAGQQLHQRVRDGLRTDTRSAVLSCALMVPVGLGAFVATRSIALPAPFVTHATGSD